MILTNKLAESEESTYFPLNEEAIQKAISALSKKKLDKAYIYHPNHEEILNKFSKTIPRVVAAGGVVTNPQGKVLFIFRNDKWDLPKGKAEKNEQLPQTALREVIEETGIKEVSIKKPLDVTYHIFKRNSEYRLKVTYWFEMFSEYEGKFNPQLDEGITDVKWIKKDDLEDVKTNSYPNIRLLF